MKRAFALQRLIRKCARLLLQGSVLVIGGLIQSKKDLAEVRLRFQALRCIACTRNWPYFRYQWERPYHHLGWLAASIGVVQPGVLPTR